MKNVFRVLIVLMFLISISVSYAEQDTDFLLTWDNPTTNTDETPLTDLDGFRVYWGVASGNYTWSKNIEKNMNPYNLHIPSGCYYFNVAAFNVWGNTSEKTNEVYLCKGLKTPSWCKNLTVE